MADLLASAAECGWGRRSLSNDSFAGHPVSRRMFTRAVEALDAVGLVIWFKGFWFRECSEFARAETGRGAPSCFRATPGFLTLAETYGIKLGNWADHFTTKMPRMLTGKAVLEVRASSTKNAKGKRQQGRKLPIDPADQRATALAERVQRQNAYLATKRIDGFSFPGLRRIFSGGDLPGFDWSMGGRFYSVRHAEAYEQWKGGCDACLELIRLDDEPVAEVDISVCHLTLLYGLLGRPMKLDTDPYSIEGQPRASVKRWLTSALGKGSSAPCG